MKYSDLENALASHLRIQTLDVRQIIHTAPYRYKHYQIRKKNGGMRDIFHPTPELKAIQRWLVSNIFSGLPVSKAAMAYETGCSIRAHAATHLKSNYFTKLDFCNFFPSINKVWITQFLRENLPILETEAIDAIVRLSCRWTNAGAPLALSIGAPSSPSLSNRILFDLDTLLIAAAASNDITYTRYADDIYFSSSLQNQLYGFEQSARLIISGTLPNLRLNEEKTLHFSKKRKVIVSGVGITSDRRLSVGRGLKRSIKTQVYLWSLGSLPLAEEPTLRGLVSFATDIEPDFRKSLDRKFSSELMSRLLTGIPATSR